MTIDEFLFRSRQASLGTLFLLTVVAVMAVSPIKTIAQEEKDSERLSMATEYFQSGKYHEALLLFCQLDKKYKLNPRFKAYMGVCYYHDGEFKEAAKEIDSCLDKLQGLSPQELTVYIYTSAESHFALEEYDLAVPLYEKMLLICHDNEKGDALFRLGFCYMQREDWATAYSYFNSSTLYYEQFGHTKEKEQRLKQIKNMMSGCKEKM